MAPCNIGCTILFSAQDTATFQYVACIFELFIWHSSTNEILMLQSGGTFAEYSKASINIQGTAFPGLLPFLPHPLPQKKRRREEIK